MKKLLFIILVLSAASAFIPESIEARPGGGHSFSSGSSSRSNSSSSYSGSNSNSHSSGGPLTESGKKFLIIIGISLFVLPFSLITANSTLKAIGKGNLSLKNFVMLILAVLAGLAYLLLKEIHWIIVFYLLISIIGVSAYVKGRKYSKAPIPVYRISPVTRTENSRDIQNQIDRIVAVDPAFSKVLFLDFVNYLYHRLYQAKASGDFKNIKPFIANDQYNKLLVDFENPGYDKAYLGKDNDITVEEIVIGNTEITYADVLKKIHAISVNIIANFTTVEDGVRRRWVAEEQWGIGRLKSKMTKAPSGVNDLECPSCGSPASFTDSGECKHCGTIVKATDNDWFLYDQKAKYTLVQTESLTHYSPEEGTNYDTLVQAGLEENMKRFAENHQIENHTAYFDKLKNEMIHQAFHDIYSAWSELRWEDVRHLLTDRMWESNNFWINQYKENNFINVLDKITIQFIDIARIELDEYFESLTARIFATCHDYVIDTKSGAVVGGKKYDRRSYSEYWTFIRRKGVEKGLDIFDKTKCPNCGAPADKMGQNAVCGYCKTKVSTGEFGWVLSAIVQDEVYKG